MADLPYLDEAGDLHVTAAMAHEATEAFHAPKALGATPALDLCDRLEAIVGRDRWPAIWRQLQSRPAAIPALLGMRIVIDE